MKHHSLATERKINVSNETSFFSSPKEVLYHITSKANLSGILANGLCPNIGNNSALCRENDQQIYLTDEKSLPYWIILLNIKDPVLLKVSDISAEEFAYDIYKEFIYTGVIIPKHISLADQSLLQSVSVEDMQALCTSYVYGLCYSCLVIVHGYTYNRVDEILFDEIETILAVIDRLDFTCYTQDKWKKIMRDYGDEGEYTFCDHYAVTDSYGPKLFEQVVLFSEDEHLAVRKHLSDTIKRIFSDCKNWETGGWTG